MRQFLKEVNSRNGEFSSKKFWYNMACAVSTVIVLYLAWYLPEKAIFVNGQWIKNNNVDDWTYLYIFLAYMCCVGGFEVILEGIRLIKGVYPPPDTTKITTETSTTVQPATPVPQPQKEGE